MSLLTNDNPAYVQMARVLGYSLMKHKVNAQRLMMLPKKAENMAHMVSSLNKTGWEVVWVDFIAQPGSQAKEEKYKSMFTKLNIYKLTQCETVVFMDVDTLVVDNFDELFDVLGSENSFAAASDNWWGTYTFGFNAGVLVIKPSLEEFQRLMTAADRKQDNYEHDMAEQAFLNYYYKLNAIRLPFRYNGNVAIYEKNQQDWWRLEKHLKIIHYTTFKPALSEKKLKEDPAKYYYNYEREMKRRLGA